MAYGYFNFEAASPEHQNSFAFNYRNGLPITKCLRSEDGSFWIFTVTEELSVSATIKAGAAFVILKGGESSRGVFSSVERHWDAEFRECFVCRSDYPRLDWVIGINAYDIEGAAEVSREPKSA